MLPSWETAIPTLKWKTTCAQTQSTLQGREALTSVQIRHTWDWTGPQCTTQVVGAKGQVASPPRKGPVLPGPLPTSPQRVSFRSVAGSILNLFQAPVGEHGPTGEDDTRVRKTKSLLKESSNLKIALDYCYKRDEGHQRKGLWGPGSQQRPQVQERILGRCQGRKTLTSDGLPPKVWTELIRPD